MQPKKKKTAARRRTWALILVLVIGGDHTVRHHFHPVGWVGVIHGLHQVGGGGKHRRQINRGAHYHFVLSLDGGNGPDEAGEAGCYQACKAHLVETTVVDVQRTKGCEYEVNADLLRAARRGLGPARFIPQRDSWADESVEGYYVNFR